MTLRRYGWNPIDRFQSRVFSSFANCLEWKKVLTCEKSSIPAGFFLYTNMVPDSLFCLQTWPPWRHVKTIYSVAIHMKAVRSFVCSPNTWYFFDLKGFFLILDVETLRGQRIPFQIVVVIPTWRLPISHLCEEHRNCRVRWSVLYRVYWRILFAQTSCLDPLSIQLCPGRFEKMRDCCSEDRTTGKKCSELENMNVKNKI